MILDKNDIMGLLPHRAPFLFVDSVESFDGSKSVSAKLWLNPDFEFFKGHFPNRPIMPGVLVEESLAQTSGLLLALIAKENKNSDFSAGDIFYLASANIKFTGVAQAGETLALKSTLGRGFNGLWQFSVSAESGRRAVAGGTLVLASPKNVAL